MPTFLFISCGLIVFYSYFSIAFFNVSPSLYIKGADEVGDIVFFINVAVIRQISLFGNGTFDKSSVTYSYKRTEANV